MFLLHGSFGFFNPLSFPLSGNSGGKSLGSPQQGKLFSSHLVLAMFWMIAASRSFFAAFRSKSNEPKS
jgi:hypothetical protein